MRETSAFVITPATAVVRPAAPAPGAPAVGEAVFTVTNTTARPLRARASIRARDAATAAWFALPEPVERTYPVQGTEQVVARIAVPPGTPVGSYPFQLLVSGVDSPDDEFGLSPSVTLEVVTPPPPPRPPFRWWWLAVVAAVLLVAVVAGVFLFQRQREVVVPNVVGQNQAAATRTLEAAGLRVGRTSNRQGARVFLNLVVQQTPAAGQRVRRGSTVDLVIGTVASTP